MKESDLEALLSEKRLATYYGLFPNDKQKAIQYYQLNTQISESLYPLLSNFEVVLRNAIHNSFKVHYKTENWYAQITYRELDDQIRVAKAKILASHNQITTDKLVAELTLGFWTSLLNKQYAKDFWKPMMYAFPLINNQLKHRDKIAFKLNQIRKFRNRIFHYEPICNNLTALSTNHSNILEVLHWINADIVTWTKQIDRFDGLYKQVSILRPVI
jgi:hypothetical protein